MDRAADPQLIAWHHHRQRFTHLDMDRLTRLKNLAFAFLRLDAGLSHHLDIRQGTAVADRHFLPVDLHQHIVNA